MASLQLVGVGSRSGQPGCFTVRNPKLAGLPYSIQRSLEGTCYRRGFPRTLTLGLGRWRAPMFLSRKYNQMGNQQMLKRGWVYFRGGLFPTTLCFVITTDGRSVARQSRSFGPLTAVAASGREDLLRHMDFFKTMSGKLSSSSVEITRNRSNPRAASPKRRNNWVPH